MPSKITGDLSFASYTILIVEDNDFVRFIVSNYLTEFGFKNILMATNGVDGIEMLQKNPHLVICDISMEPMNGFEFLKLLRAQKGPQGKIPVIFLTGAADEQAVKQAVTLKADAYLLKPIAPEVLKQKLITLLSRVATSG